MTRIFVALIAMGASAAQAGPLEVEAGAAAVLFDTPAESAAEALDTRVATAITATLSPDPKFPVGIRLHASIGRQGSGLRTLGVAFRQKNGALVIDTGLGIASAVGVVSDGMSESLRPHGFGIAFDVRIGYTLGPVVVSAFALPTYVFASESHAHEAHLRSVIEAGISLGRSL